MKKSCILTLIGLAAALSASEHGGFPTDCRIAVELPTGMCPPNRLTSRRPLQIDLKLQDGKPMKKCWGFAPTYNLSEHDGEVRGNSVKEGKLCVSIGLKVNPDPYVPGFKGEWDLELKASDGEVTGSYVARLPIDHADYDPIKLEGTLTGRVTAPWPHPVAKHRPLPNGAHPKLFFSKEDVPALRERAKTGPGKAIVDRLRSMLTRSRVSFASNGYHAAGWGLLWQLEGKKEHLEKAKQLCVILASYNAPQEQYFGFPQMIGGLAVAYDLCYDGWDRETRSAFGGHLRRWSQMLSLLRWPMYHTGGRGNHPLIKNLRNDSVEMLHWRSACGLAALAVMGDPWNMPHMLQPKPVINAASPAGFKVQEGMAVEPFLRARQGVPQAWTFSGPLDKSIAEALLADPGAARLVGCAGVKIGACEWTQLPVAKPGKKGRKGPARPLEVLGPFGKQRDKIGFFSTVLHLKRPRVVRFDFAYRSMALYVSGQRISGRGKHLRLSAGHHPLLISFHARRTPFRSMVVKSFIREVEDPLPKYEAWKKRKERWVAQGKTHLDMDRDAAIFVRQVGKILNLATGDHGSANSHAQWGLALEQTLPFAIAARRVLGIDMAKGSALQRVVPYMLVSDFLETHLPERGHINDYNIVAAGLPFAKPQHRACMRWFLDRNTFGVGNPLHATLALAHYPADTAPTPPNGALPLAVHDAKSGATVFRSGWDDGAFVANALGARLGYVGFGSQNAPQRAGEIGIRGFGTGLKHKGAGAWIQPAYSLVNNPFCTQGANCLRIAGCVPIRGAQVLHHAEGPDGSGTVTFALNHWVEGERDASYRGYPWTNVKKGTKDLGIKALRAFAADYSGKAGVPGLFVVVDRVTGAGSRAVSAPFRIGVSGPIDATDKRAVIRGPDGRSMRIMLPGNGKLEVTPAGKPSTVWVRGATASMVVITIQKGEPPALEIEGEGLDAKVRVGERTVRFDGTTITLE